MSYRLGIDIGGTTAKIGVVDENFKVVKSAAAPTKGISADGIIESIAEAARPLLREYKVESAGIGSPGRVVRETGIVERCGNLPFNVYPVAGNISRALSLPALIDNDANCALIGERAAGVLTGLQNALIITLGTGIGGAILIHGRVYRGHNNRAGELGHFCMDLNGEECECGLHGCFEMQASATALIKLTAQYAAQYPDSLLAKACGEKISGRTAFAAARAGCPAAKALLDEYGRRLALGLDSLCYVFQPQMIAVSGGISREGQFLLDYINPHRVADNPVKTSSLQGEGGLIGAALLGTEYAV